MKILPVFCRIKSNGVKISMITRYFGPAFPELQAYMLFVVSITHSVMSEMTQNWEEMTLNFSSKQDCRKTGSPILF